MPSISLDTSDATELLQFVKDWLTTDHPTLEAWLGRFIGHPGYDLPSCVMTSAASRLCSAATTAGHNSSRPVTNPK